VDWPFKFEVWAFLTRDFLANQMTETRRKDILIPHNCLKLVKRNIYDTSPSYVNDKWKYNAGGTETRYCKLLTALPVTGFDRQSDTLG